MKKAMVGVAAVGAVIALRPLVRRMAQKMREHCAEMMSAQSNGHGEATEQGPTARRMHEHCKEMAAQAADRGEPVATA